jgi:predicted ATPase
MQLRKLSLETSKIFKNKTEFDFKNLTILIGPNKAGKSNVIEGLRTLTYLAKGQLQGDYNELVFDKKSGNVTIELELELSNTELKKVIGHFSKQQEIFESFNYENERLFRFVKYRTVFNSQELVEEELSVSNQDGLFVSLVSNETGPDGRGICNFIDLENYFAEKKKMILDQTDNTNSDATVFTKQHQILRRQQGTIALKIGDLVDEFVKKIKIMSVTRHATPQLTSKEEYELDSEGSNLVTVLNTIRNHTDNYPELSKWLEKILGETTTKVYAPPIGSYITVLLREQGLENRTNLANLSKGIEQILISLLMFEKTEGSIISLLCIEEPEVHIHSSAQKVLFEYFQEKSLEVQLLITTHSSLFTSLAVGSKVYLLNKKDGISEGISIDKQSELVLVRRSLGINNSDIYGADNIIFLEGPNDVTSFETVAKVLGFDQIGKNIFVESLGGTDNSPNLTFLARYFKKSQCSFFAILDHHANGANCGASMNHMTVYFQ